MEEKMKELIIERITKSMSNCLNKGELRKLRKCLEFELMNVDVLPKNDEKGSDIISNHLSEFLSAKRVEGLSEKSLKYYKNTINAMLSKVGKNVFQINTDDLRNYLSEYQKINDTSQITIDNIRRILSTYFTWLEDEDYILKSPIRRIHKIKTGFTVKQIYSDEDLEKMRDGCNNPRDLALIDMLASTGIRVGELVRLNKEDINFAERECKVLGKGNKERIVYFDARTKVHLEMYLSTRKYKNDALFVSLNSPFERLSIGAVESRVKKIGNQLNLGRVHPHKFRRSLATNAIDKGMPIEQLQVLLGHKRIDTTLQYAMVNQNNVKNSYRKVIG